MSEYLPPVVARLMGDVKDFQEKFGAADQTMSDTEARSGSSGPAIGRNIAGGMVAAGAALSGIGVQLTHIGDGLEQARKQLEAAGTAAGIPLKQLDDITKRADTKMENFGHTSTDTDGALQKLVQAGRPAEEMTKDMALAADLAASKHISLTTAASLIAKVYGGNAKALKEYGINLKEVGGPGAALDELTGKVKGQAAAAVDTFGGHIDVAKVKVEDFVARVGTKVGPALAVFGPAVGGVGMAIQSGLVPMLASGIGSALSFAGGLIGAGLSAAGAALPVIIAWAPVIIFVAAIGLAAYELYKHWDQVWGFIKDIASTAFAWIKDHMALIADVVLLPIEPLVLLWQHWDQVWGFIKTIASDAWGWLRDTISSGISDVVGFVGSLPGRAADALSSLGGDIVGVAADAMSSMWDATERGVGDVVDAVSRLPGRAAGALGDLGGWLYGAGRALLEGMINGLESMGGRLADAALSPVRHAVDAVKSFLHIGSPSRLFHGFGVNIGEGLEQGMLHKTSDVADAAVGLASSSVPGFASTGGGAGGSAVAGMAAGGGIVIHIHGGDIYTATGDIPEATLRKFRDQFFRMLDDLPPGSVLPS